MSNSDRSVAVEYLGFLGASLLRHVKLAATTGFDAAEIRLSPAQHADRTAGLRPRDPAARALATALADSGMTVLDVEVVAVTSRTTPELDATRRLVDQQ